MIRALTLLIFVLTPLAAAASWMAAGPLVALVVLVGLPVAGVAGVVLRLRRSPDAVAGLLKTRNRLQSRDL